MRVQGLNKAEAAERLGLPEGTVSSRLARAREMLRDRLTRRGVVVPAAALGTLLTADTLQAAVPPAGRSAAGRAPRPALVSPTVLTLSHEVLRSMTLLKLKTLCVVAMSVALTGGGFGLYAIKADDKKPAAEKPAVTPAKPGEKPAEARRREAQARAGRREAQAGAKPEEAGAAVRRQSRRSTPRRTRSCSP